MNTVNIAFVQWPELLLPTGSTWDGIRRRIEAANADIVVTNEMPFGPWIAESPTFDARAARESVVLHEDALAALGALEAEAVISSRPVVAGDRLANEAFVLDASGYRWIHHKQYFPQEEGFYEESWFRRERRGFETVKVGAVNVGVLLCTELFFNEHARSYGRQGADLIVTPRASGTSLHRWRTAGCMAAIVSGAYLVSSNRVGRAEQGQVFGGSGFTVSPEGLIEAVTGERTPVTVVKIHLDLARRQKSEYPCYVKELNR